MAEARPGKDYFGWSKVASVICAIIPITAWIFGLCVKAQHFSKDGGAWPIICLILRVIFGWNILWILDLVFIIIDDHIFEYL